MSNNLFICYSYYFLIVFGQSHSLATSRTLFVNNGDQLVLWCSNRDLHSLPEIRSLTWTKDSVIIADEDPRLNTVANGTLLIEQVRENDAGTYTCTLEAIGFVSTNTTTLYVRGKRFFPLHESFLRFSFFPSPTTEQLYLLYNLPP